MEVSALRQPQVLRGPTPLLRLQGDDRLVTLTRRGNQAAYEALVARYQARLLAFCRHMLGSREDAEDVLQDVFAAAFNAMMADDRDLNVRPWLYRIARNRCLNHLRRQTAIGVDSMDVHLADHGVSTAERVYRREEFRELVVDVQGLPESQRTALLLREIDALSYDQIAEAMETTVPSVKSLLVRARVSLAESAEARRLSCDEVRLELGEVAEGLRHSKTPPVRRHVRECTRCAEFEKDLRRTNRALNAILPVGPLLLLKKFLVTQAGASSAASASAAASGAAGAAGAAGAGSALTAGVAAVATKTAAGLAAAALVTAGAVEVDHVRHLPTHRPSVAAQVAAAPAPAHGIPPIAEIARIPATVVPHVVASRPQPTKTVRPKDAAATTAPAVAAPVTAPTVAGAPVTPDPSLTASGTTTIAQTVTPSTKAPDTGSDVTSMPAEDKPAPPATPPKDTSTTSTTTASSTTTTSTTPATTTTTPTTTSTTPTTTTTTPSTTTTTPAPPPDPAPSGGGGTSTTPTGP